MKLRLSSALLFFAAILFFSSCEKEYSFENGGTPGVIVGGSSGGTAIFTFNGGTGSCTGAVSGTYTAGTALGAANTVAIHLNVDSIGTYTLSTSTNNGISFSGSGTFTATGSQTITLTGTGTPLTAGTFNYTPGATGCTFSITAAGVVSSVNCKSCEYYPACPTSWYKYADTINGTASEFTSTHVSFIDTTISGVAYQKLTYSTVPASMGGNSAVYYNCNNGVTTLKTYNSVTIISGTVVAEATVRPIKANEAVGSIWTDINDLPGGGGQTYESTFSVVEKGITRVLGGTTFTDVIHIHLSTGTTILGTYLESATTEYYYARGIGLIEAITTNSLTGNIFLHQVIISYFIP